MREIIFRGRRLDNGEWIEGDLRHYPSGAVAIRNDLFGNTVKVNPTTVGQYTGLKDKNGERIFEGDIVSFDNGLFVVTYFDSRMSFGFSGLKGRGVVPGFHMTDWEHLKVIGNIHDNPELMEG